MKKLGFVEGGDAARLGVGAKTDERWKSTFELMVAGGAYSKDLDYRKAYSLEFVNKRLGL
jgi:NitT/TauT family transport system substrate-binding protein